MLCNASRIDGDGALQEAEEKARREAEEKAKKVRGAER